MPLSFRSAGPDDVETIRQLAERIWHACYPAILSAAQIRYMLAWMYAPHKLTGEMARGVTYEVALLDDEPVGYLAHEALADGSTRHLNKLYLVPELHGHGHGQAMLRRVLTAAADTGARTMELRVNRANAAAVRAYLRAGFGIAETVRQDIGAGFVMDDFVMRRAVTEPRAEP